MTEEIKIEKPKWQDFDTGNLSGIRLLMLDDYRKTYSDSNYDTAMFNDFRQLGKKNVIYDIGAFIGITSLLFSREMGESGRVYSFEPNPSNMAAMMRNFSMNLSLSQKVIPMSFAIGDKTGEGELLCCDKVLTGESSTSRLNGAYCFLSNTAVTRLGFKTQYVDMMTLDDMVAKIKNVPDVVKIDVEGAEHLVLMGSINTVVNHQPVIYMEIHSAICAMRCIDFLNAYRYKYDVLNEEEDGRVFIKAVHGANNEE